MFYNVYYQKNLCEIGGVETFLYELARLVNKHGRDLTILYKTGSEKQVRRIAKYCRILKYDSVPKPIKCKRAFFNYAIETIDNFEAEEYIQLVHADFQSQILKDLKYPPIVSDKITKYYAVSANNAKSYKEITGNDIEVLYNPIQIDKEPRVMTIISAQRTSPEKGGKRCEQLIEALDKSGVPYVWHHFSNGTFNIKSENVMYHKPTLDIRRWIKYADYMVILSDTEGFPYSAYESLCLGTPLIITRLPIVDELGCTKDNSIILDFNMQNLNVKEIYKKAGKLKFEYKKKPDGWLDLLPEKGTYEYVEPKQVRIRALYRYTDMILDKIIEIGTEYEVDEERAQMIIDKGYAIKAEDI